MYYFLTGAIVRRTIQDLRRFWSYHPKYRDDLVQNIQGKFSYETEPQHGIVVKFGSANHIRLSADDFRGINRSYVTLVKADNAPGLSIEWIIEDARAIQNNGGVFPSPPGLYFISILSVDGLVKGDPPIAPGQANPNQGIIEFEVHPLLDVFDEGVDPVTDVDFQLSNIPLEGSVYLRRNPGNVELSEGTGYEVDYVTGVILTSMALREGEYLIADYRYTVDPSGPWQVRENMSHNRAIPGVVLAFGRRAEAGDRLAVVCTEKREPASLEYGGRWDLSLDIDVFSRDVESQREITDMTTMFLLGILRSYWSTEGLEIESVDIGGESEEVYDDNADDYFFNANLSMTVQVEWSIKTPIIGFIRQILPLGASAAQGYSGLSDEEVAQVGSSIEMLDSMGFESFRDPFFTKKNGTFETIG